MYGLQTWKSSMELSEMLHLPTPPLSLINTHTSKQKLSNLKYFRPSVGNWIIIFLIPLGRHHCLFISFYTFGWTIMYLLYRVDVPRFTPHAFSLALQTDLQLLSYVRVTYCTSKLSFKHIHWNINLLSVIFSKGLSAIYLCIVSLQKSILTECKFRKKFTTRLIGSCMY